MENFSALTALSVYAFRGYGVRSLQPRTSDVKALPTQSYSGDCSILSMNKPVSAEIAFPCASRFWVKKFGHNIFEPGQSFSLMRGFLADFGLSRDLFALCDAPEWIAEMTMGKSTKATKHSTTAPKSGQEAGCSTSGA